jgi:hypothetical protein
MITDCRNEPAGSMTSAPLNVKSTTKREDETAALPSCFCQHQGQPTIAGRSPGAHDGRGAARGEQYRQALPMLLRSVGRRKGVDPDKGLENPSRTHKRAAIGGSRTKFRRITLTGQPVLIEPFPVRRRPMGAIIHDCGESTTKENGNEETCFHSQRGCSRSHCGFHFRSDAARPRPPPIMLVWVGGAQRPREPKQLSHDCGSRSTYRV